MNMILVAKGNFVGSDVKLARILSHVGEITTSEQYQGLATMARNRSDQRRHTEHSLAKF